MEDGKMRILANDGLKKEGIKLFNDASMEVDTKKKDKNELLEKIVDYDGLIIRSATKVTADVIEAGKDRLKIIGRAGKSCDNIDLEAAMRYGIEVKRVPDAINRTVAEQVMGLIYSVSRNIPQAHHHLKNGAWFKKRYEGFDIQHKTVGIIGFGGIGQEFCKLAENNGMKCLAYDLKHDPKIRKERYSPTMEKLLSSADYVVVQVDGTKEIIGKKELSQMKNTAYLINAARGTCVNEDALYEALANNYIAGAGLDVHKIEPKEGKEQKQPAEAEDVKEEEEDIDKQPKNEKNDKEDEEDRKSVV